MGERRHRKPSKRRRKPGESRWAHAVAGWKRRHQAKKRRLARMTRRRRVARRIGIAATWALALVTVVLVAAVALFYTLSDVPRPEALPLPQVATILYADGSPMAHIGTVNRTIVTLDKVPEQVRWDVLAAEDRNFYNDPGVSIKGTLRAALSDITGGDTQGGSGITQQYAKNAYLSDARTLSRKLKELMIAVKLSREYSKDQILEYYLNTVYFGRGAYGIQAAAEAYFHKDVSALDVSEGAVLAALLRAPGYYDPAVNPAAAKARWTYVLDGMVATKHLTQGQQDALAYPAVAPPESTKLGATGNTYLIVQRVLAELQAHGISQDEVYQRGLTITTTIDPKAQNAATSAIGQTFANLTDQQKTMKNALIAVNPATGGVLAYYGGPNGPGYDGKPDYNDYAGVGARPAGSSFKPYTLATVLTQTLTKAPGKQPLTINSAYDGSYCVTIQANKICNDPSDRQYSGSAVSIRNAMKYSLNTTFDQLALEAGPNEVAATAHAAGISTTDANGNPTLVNADGQTGFNIGIGDYAVHPIDQAVGFATFANNGVRNDAYFVQKAVDSNGSTVYSHQAAPKQAIDPKVANDVTMTLEPIASWSRAALSGGRQSGAKTGTEGIPNDPKNNNSDAWMVGFTPQVSCAVWVGSGNSTTPIYNSAGGQEYGSDLPGKTWKLFMDTYLAGQPKLPLPNKVMVTNAADAAVPTDTAPAPEPTTRSPTPSPTSTVKPGSSSPTPSPTSTSTHATATVSPSASCTPPAGRLNTCPPAVPSPGG